jgi:predicted metal-dependent phosphotriesterase family hydrolase
MTTIPTVLGPLDPTALGRVLPHEHIASVYGRWGQQQPEPDPTWEAEVLAHYGPLLTRLRQEFDCHTLVEVSPSWGFRGPRDLEVWAELSRASGVHIVVATGFYVGKVRPPDFGDWSVARIADLMIREATEGILGSSVRAGILKVAVGDFDADDRKLVRAAALAQRETGLAITTHTCSPEVRRGVLDILEGAGVDPARIVLGHADDNATPVELLSLVARGCSVLLTIWGIRNPALIGWGLPVLPRFHSPSLVAALVAEGYAERVMISIDYSAGFEQGRFVPDLYEVEGRTYLYLFTQVLDTLRRVGLDDATIEHILRDNPRRMLTAT